MELIVELGIAMGIILLLIMALIIRKKEKKENIEEENDEENGKYWDSDEQRWLSKREVGRIQERKETYQKGTTDLLKKHILAFLYDENPDLANLDSKGFAQLNTLVAKNAQLLLKEVEKLKTDFVAKK